MTQVYAIEIYDSGAASAILAILTTRRRAQLYLARNGYKLQEGSSHVYYLHRMLGARLFPYARIIAFQLNPR